MRYNQLSYHKASPFAKQGYLPDRAWYNRKPKEFPSQIPTGQEYFTEVGRKHYDRKFNHSEIEETGVLTSPQKYAYQNRLAMDKSYNRNMDTTDIEGAGSGTRVNEAIRYKLRAQEELARKYNQPLDLSENKEHMYEERRRELAVKQSQTIEVRKGKEKEAKEGRERNQVMDTSRMSVNPEREMQQMQQMEAGRYYENPRTQRSNSLNEHQYIQLIPKPYYANLDHQNQTLQPQTQTQAQATYSKTPPMEPQQEQYPPQHPQRHQQPQPQSLQQPPYYQPRTNSKQDEQAEHLFNTNDRHKSNPAYMNNYESELQRRQDDYQKTIDLDEMSKNSLLDKNDFRKHSPTNLSFSLAGKAVVGGR